MTKLRIFTEYLLKTYYCHKCRQVFTAYKVPDKCLLCGSKDWKVKG